jgi:hypothetical protein
MLRSRNSASVIRRNGRSLATAAMLCTCSVLLGACSSVISAIPTQMGGLPAGTPARADDPPAYPAVHDMPPPRSAAVLTEEERKKVEAELAAMREEQAKKAAEKLPE